MSSNQVCSLNLKFGPVLEYDMLITKMTMLIVIPCIINEYIYDYVMSFHQDRPFGLKFGPVIGNNILIWKY